MITAINPIFSGLSLLIHATIVGVATVVNFFRQIGDRSLSRSTSWEKSSTMERRVKSVLAVSLLFSIMLFMVVVLSIVVTTSARIGATEPQREYIQKITQNILTWENNEKTSPINTNKNNNKTPYTPPKNTLWHATVAEETILNK